jgi:hypothetical protein
VAVVLIVLATDDVQAAFDVLVATALVSSVIALVGSRGRHLAWVVFLIVALAIWFGTRGVHALS